MLSLKPAAGHVQVVGVVLVKFSPQPAISHCDLSLEQSLHPATAQDSHVLGVAILLSLNP